MKTKLIAVSLMLILSATSMASTLHPNWEVGSCAEIDQQIQNEKNEKFKSYVDGLESTHEKLAKLIEFVRSSVELSHLNSLESDYSKYQDALRSVMKSLVRSECTNQPIQLEGRNDGNKVDFNLMYAYCSPRKFSNDSEVRFSFLAIGKNNRNHLFADNKDHLLARFCTSSKALVTRADRSREWLKLNSSYCLNYDLLTNKFFSYDSKKSTPTLDFGDQGYTLQYSYTYYDLNRVLTPGGVTSSVSVRPNLEATEDILIDLLTPKDCRTSGKPLSPNDYFLKLVPKAKEACAWYDAFCRFLN